MGPGSSREREGWCKLRKLHVEGCESEGDQGSSRSRAPFLSRWGWRWLILKILAFPRGLDQVTVRKSSNLTGI